jgi:hypothetical protein
MEGRQTVAEKVQDLRPRNSLAEYHSLLGSAGLFPQFVAVVAGLRPGMDCWVRSKNLESFIRFIERQGLSHSVDCGFRKLQAGDQPIGVETLCTTHAVGIQVEDADSEDEIHIFVARTRDVAERMRSSGWYPVVVNGRILPKPFIDHLEFGRLLGYPGCCIDFFEKSNNWNRTNSYAEAYRNTTCRFDCRTNCFGKNLGYSLNFHLPCRFDCSDTVRLSSDLFNFLKYIEPEYSDLCWELLHKPVLSLNERENVLFDGSVNNGHIRYESALNLFLTPAPKMNAIREGNVVEIRGRFVVVLRNREVVDIFECRCDEFGPQVPLLMTWS